MKCSTVRPHVESLDRRLLLAATPVLVKEMSIGTWGSDPRDYEDVGGTVFFVASDNSFAHDELWKTDGTPAGTVRVKDFGALTWEGVQLSDLTAVGGRLFFSAPDVGGGNQELWTSDGTEAGTHRVKDIVPGPGSSDPRSNLLRNLSVARATASLARSRGPLVSTWI